VARASDIESDAGDAVGDIRRDVDRFVRVRGAQRLDDVGEFARADRFERDRDRLAAHVPVSAGRLGGEMPPRHRSRHPGENESDDDQKGGAAHMVISCCPSDMRPA
jgi:hypothetical protein